MAIPRPVVQEKPRVRLGGGRGRFSPLARLRLPAPTLRGSPAPRLDSPGLGARGHRAEERALLLWNLLPLLLGALAVGVTAPAGISSALGAALGTLAPIYLACLAAHLLFCLLRVEGDQLLLPILCLLFLIGGVYHQGVGRPGGGVTADAYKVGVLIGVSLIALLVAGAPLLRRLALRFEEKVWWRVAGDTPYYASLPFHLLLLGGMAVLLLWLRVFGRPDEGSAGAIVQVPLPGGWSFTPSEFVRLAVAFFLAEYLAVNARVMRNLREPLGRCWPFCRLRVEHKPELVVVLAMLLLYCAFFYLFRDFGPAVIIVVLTLLCLLVATGRATTPLLLAGIAFLLVAVPVFLGWGFRTLQHRVAMWINPWETAFEGGDHLARALWGVASGGWFGIGVGSVNLRPMLPEAARDTVFAGIATTMGFWVAAVVLALYAALVWRGLSIGSAVATDRGRLLAFSLTSLLWIEALWICAASVRMLPLSGINLPFLSTGISSMIASCVPVAVLLHLSGDPAREEAGLNRQAALEAVSPALLGKVTRLAPFTFGLPLLGLVLYGVPFLLGDRTLIQSAVAIGREGERAEFANPYLAAFRAGFPRGRILSADGKVLASGVPEMKSRGAGRVYPLGAAAAQLVGWTTQGRFAAAEGSVEAEFDAELRGYREAELPYYFRTRHFPLARRPKPQDVTLTVRSDLQQYVDRRLRQTIRRYRGAGGAALLFDATTGRVLAAATAPGLDPNHLTRERMERYARQHRQTQVLAHKALSRETLFFPGSTFKLLTAAAALSDPTSVEGSVLCQAANGEPLTWSWAGRRYRRKVGAIHDYGLSRHGAFSLCHDIDDALAVSCNVFFATLATRLGPERLSSALREAGLKVAPNPDSIAPYLPEAGFGQIVVKVAPIELARLAGAIGRAEPRSEGGFSDVSGEYPGCPEPFWVEKVGTSPAPAGRVGSPGETPYRPFPPEVARRLREMMTRVVSDPSGTAYRAFHDGAGRERLPHLEIGGKTGTAEFEKLVTLPSGQKGRARGKHAWFVGFARERDRIPPRVLAFAVLVEDAKGRATGGAVCAPLAHDMLARLLPPTHRDGVRWSPFPATRDGNGWLGDFFERVEVGVEIARRVLGRLAGEGR